MKVSTLVLVSTFVLYMSAREATNEELALIVHRLVGDVGILKQASQDQTTILHKQDQAIQAVESSVALLTQVTGLLQQTVASLNGKFDEHISDIKGTFLRNI